MRFVAIGDIHGQFDEMYYKLCDSTANVLLMVGDYTAWDRKYEYDFLEEYLSDLDFKYIIYIAGNHDGQLAKGRRFKNAIYIEDSAVEIGGITIYGSPWSPIFYNWHYMLPKEELEKKFKQIPGNTDILLTHCPPYGVFDYVDGRRAGSEELALRLKEIPTIKYHVFGHIHESYGMIEKSGSTSFINCSFYPSFNLPFEFELCIG